MERTFRNELALRTQEEVAALLHIDRRSVQQTERRAFDKLQRSPALRHLHGREREWDDGRLDRYEQALREWTDMARRLEAMGAIEEAKEIRVEAETFSMVLNGNRR